MKRLGWFVATTAAIAISTTGMAAQGKSGTKGAPAAAAKGPSVKADAPKTTGSAATTTTVKSNAHGSSQAAKNTGKPTTTASTSPTATATGTTTTATTVAPNAISAKIAAKPNQLAHIKTQLPAGMTLEQASAGFRNQGQFIAALNASKNQGVDFKLLQTAMTVDGKSLGQAVKELRGVTPPATPPTTTTPTDGSTTTGNTTTGTTNTTSGTTTGTSTTATTPAS